MKITRIFIIVLVAFLFAGKSYGQTAGEVMDKYLNAIGGKAKISNIKSFYTEGKMQVMGMEVKSKTTVLNGKGWRQEIDMMSQNQVTSLNEKGGWLSLPMQGSAAPTDMPADVYNKAKSKMIVGEPLVNYQANDSKVELAGNETIGNINAIKLKMVKPDNTFDTYYFDPASYFLIRSVQKENMRGQDVEITVNYSNYKDAGNGYMYPFTTETDMGNGMAAWLGYSPQILSTSIDSEAKVMGKFLASLAREIKINEDSPIAPRPPCAVIAGGETIVKLTGSGKGGRNQEIALVAALGIEGLEEVVIFSLGSDGTDGPTDAAGGIADGQTTERMRLNSVSPELSLANNDSYHALKASGDLIMTGPTGTNVNDLMVILCR